MKEFRECSGLKIGDWICEQPRFIEGSTPNLLATAYTFGKIIGKEHGRWKVQTWTKLGENISRYGHFALGMRMFVLDEDEVNKLERQVMLLGIEHD